MSYTEDLIVAIAVETAANGLARWQPSGAYTGSGAPPITLGLMLDKPDAMIALSAYGGSMHAALSNASQPVQFLVRGTTNPLSAQSVVDGLCELWVGRTDFDLGYAHVDLVRQRSVLPTGFDAAGRPTLSLNLEFALTRATAHRFG